MTYEHDPMNADHQRWYLQTMGIQGWESRRPASQTETTPDAGMQSSEVGPTDPSVGGAIQPALASTGAPPSSSLSRADVDTPQRTEPDDIPREYADWARVVDQDQDQDRDFDLDLELESKPEDRTARIARMDWDALQAEVERCTACELHQTRTQGVFGVGNREADWLIVGEAPGADEDRLGKPFVGRGGKLLDTMLLALGLTRKQVYIANILKSRPPNNRDPRPEEVRACWPYLERQIELLRPRIILAVGRIAAQNLLRTDVNIGRLRGRVHRFGSQRLPLVVTYHPAYLLRSPSQKAKAWDDLQLARRTLLEEANEREPRGEET
jgi:DNA polymerase